MDIQQQIHTRKVHAYEECEEEDDVFYDELRRQVMQLTAEDDDVVHKARKQGPFHGPCSIGQPLRYYGWPGIKEGCGDTPAWMLNLWRSGAGTGVFIPQTVPSRRKNRSGRKNEKGRIYKKVERMN